MNVKSEYVMVTLVIVLFFISLIQSWSLLIFTGVLVCLYSIITLRTINLWRQIREVWLFLALLAVPIIIELLTQQKIDSSYFALIIMFKVSISIILLGTIADRYSELYIVEGLLNLGFPAVINQIIALTFRYFYMARSDIAIGRNALVSRGINERKWSQKIYSIGEWIGGFFLKSDNHAEQVYRAIKLRGYHGQSRGSLTANKPLLAYSLVLIGTLSIVLIIL